MHCVLKDATDGPIGARPSRSITGPPAVIGPKNRKLHFEPLPAAAIDGRSLSALAFHTAEPSGGSIPKMRTW